MNPILVERTRGGIVESFHRGAVCLVNDKKEIVFSLGDSDQMCFPRSALKFIQVIPLLEDGGKEFFNFTDEEIAIMCGSHNGEKIHTRVVESILEKIGCKESDLKCGMQPPTLTEDKNELIRAFENPRQIHNNCSGKHAGFLAYCILHNLPLENYAEISHPLHQRILSLAAEIHEVEIQNIAVGLDGCSAPIFSFTVYKQALAYMKLSNPEQFFEGSRKSAVEQVLKSVTNYPYMIAGKNRYCTDLMELSNHQLLAKTGADGVYSIGFINKGLGCCIKVDDGLMGPQYNVAQEVIVKSGVLDAENIEKLSHYIQEPLKNWNRLVVGEVITKSHLFEKFPKIY